MDLLQLNHRLLDLEHELEAEVAILQHHPRALRHARRDELARRGLLPLAERDRADGLLELARELHDDCRRVGALREHGDDGAAAVGLLLHLAQVERPRVDELLPDGVRDVVLRAEQHPIVADRADDEQQVEGRVERHLRQLLLLRRVVVVPRAPLLREAADRVGQVAKLGRQRPGEGNHVEPDRVRHPLARLGLLALEVERGAAGEEDLHRLLAERAGDELDLHCEHQRPDLLVALEEAALHVARGVKRHELNDVHDALRRERRRRRLFDRIVEECEELLQRDLVHGVDARHVDDKEVEEGAARRHRPVLLARGGDARVRLGRVLELLLDLRGGGLGVLQHLDQARVVEQVARRARQPVEQVILEALERLLVRVDLLDQLLPLLLELVPLLLHDAPEQLLLEAAHRHREVDDLHLRTHLGREVRVAHPARHVHAERLGVLALLVGEHHLEPAPALLHLLVEHRVEDRVERLLHILEQQRLAKGHRVLQRIPEALVAERRDAQPVHLVAPLDPRDALRLWVDQQRPLGRARHHDAVLHRQLVRRQPLVRPVAHRALVDHELGHLQPLGHRDLLLHAVGVEALVEQDGAEVGVERPRVRDEGARERDVARHPADLVGERLRVGLPARVLAGERADELVRRVHPLLRRVGVGLNGLLLGHRRVKVGLHRLQRLVDDVELALRLGELLHRHVELALRHLERGDLRLHLFGDGRVEHHRLDPRREPRDVARRLLRVLVGEVLGRRVRVEQLDRLVVDAVLLELREVVDVLEEGRAPHHLRRLRPRHLELQPLDHHRLRRDERLVEEDEHAVEEPLDQLGRLLEHLEHLDVLASDRRERRLRLVERRLGGGQVLLDDTLVLRDHLRLARQRVLDGLHLRLLLLRLGRRRRDVLQQDGRLLLRDDERLLLLAQLDLHVLDVGPRLLELREAHVDRAREVLDVPHLLDVHLAVERDEAEV
mmetsp:Transcript_69183/g.207521  ORF Transcript_69183/g.207521 Transcript_69183/m.207521 type:complete len:952 (-) Transcript_69183:1492-4347(-)